jgi:hypothetical protein
MNYYTIFKIGEHYPKIGANAREGVYRVFLGWFGNISDVKNNDKNVRIIVLVLGLAIPKKLGQLVPSRSPRFQTQIPTILAPFAANHRDGLSNTKMHNDAERMFT